MIAWRRGGVARRGASAAKRADAGDRVSQQRVDRPVCPSPRCAATRPCRERLRLRAKRDDRISLARCHQRGLLFLARREPSPASRICVASKERREASANKPDRLSPARQEGGAFLATDPPATPKIAPARAVMTHRPNLWDPLVLTTPNI